MQIQVNFHPSTAEVRPPLKENDYRVHHLLKASFSLLKSNPKCLTLKIIFSLKSIFQLVLYFLLNFTLDLYQSSDSWMFLEARFSYCRRTSLKAAVRSGLAISMSTCTCCCCCWAWLCSSSISCNRNSEPSCTHCCNVALGKVPKPTNLPWLKKKYLKWFGFCKPLRTCNVFAAERFSFLCPHKKRAYLIMQLLKEVNFLLERLNLSLQIQSCQCSVVHILFHDTDS